MIARPYRLRDEADVRRVRSRGKAFASGPLVARILPNTLEPAQNRYTVIAGKKCGKAVDRNRLKRLTREALRGYHPCLRPGWDVAIVVRGDRVELPTLEVAQATLQRIFRKASLFQPHIDIPPAGTPITTGWNRKDEGSRVEDGANPTPPESDPVGEETGSRRAAGLVPAQRREKEATRVGQGEETISTPSSILYPSSSDHPSSS